MDETTVVKQVLEWIPDNLRRNLGG